jgi:hypothetical protein
MSQESQGGTGKLSGRGGSGAREIVDMSAQRDSPSSQAAAAVVPAAASAVAVVPAAGVKRMRPIEIDADDDIGVASGERAVNLISRE